MEKIKLFPKFYSNEEKMERTIQMKKAVQELLRSEVLPDRAKEHVRTVICNMTLMGDTYSRNYEIKKLNSFIDAFNALSK